ncbi:hypothetical protein ACLOJK_031255 [Asimina triloba]
MAQQPNPVERQKRAFLFGISASRYRSCLRLAEEVEDRSRKMHWVRADSSDFAGTLPHPRSGHTAVNVGKSMVVIFGGLVDKRFLNDVCVYDTG